MTPPPPATAPPLPPPRQRVLMFYEPPSTNWQHVFQQKANFAVRVLAKYGYSLVPIDLPVPRLAFSLAKMAARAAALGANGTMT